MSYQFLKENENSFVMKHPSGKEFSVAKKGLNEETIAKIKATGVQKLADGGDVLDPLADKSSLPAAPAPDSLNQIVTDAQSAPVRPEYAQLLAMEQAKNLPHSGIAPNPPEARALSDLQNLDALKQVAPESLSNFQSTQLHNLAQSATPSPAITNAGQLAAIGNAGAQPAQMTPASMTAQQEAQAGQGAGQPPSSNPMDPMGMMGQVGDIYKQQAGALGKMADSQVQEHQAAAAAYKNYLDQQQVVQKNYDQQFQDINKEGDAIRDKIQAGQINPHQLWDNKSTGQKVLAGIGLALSGIGSGLTHTPNAALGILQKQIEDDIDAQKANLGKQSTLYTMNMQKYHNAEQAEAATRLQLNNVLQGQIAQGAAQAGTPQALAQRDYMVGQLKMQALQTAHQFALTGLKAQQAGAGGQEGGLPIGQEPAAFLSNPEYLKTRVQINDRAYPAVNEKEAEEVRNMQANYSPIVQGMQTLDGLGKAALVPGSREARQADVVRRALAQKLTQWNNLGGNAKLSDTALTEAKEQLDNPSSFKEILTGGVKDSALKKVLDSEVEARYKASIPGYRGVDQYKSFQPVSAQAPMAKR